MSHYTAVVEIHHAQQERPQGIRAAAGERGTTVKREVARIIIRNTNLDKLKTAVQNHMELIEDTAE